MLLYSAASDADVHYSIMILVGRLDLQKFEAAEGIGPVANCLSAGELVVRTVD